MFQVLSPVFPPSFRVATSTLVIGAIGGGLFWLAGMPAPWLSGSMIAVSMATLFGLGTAMPAHLRDALFVVLGISMGSGVRPDIVERIGHWPLSLVLLAMAIAAITFATFAFLVAIARWERSTALFAAIPGTLSYVLALATDSDADLRRVGIAQTIRLFFLVAVLPSILSEGLAHSGSARVTSDFGPLMLFVMLTVAAGAGWLANRARIPAGWLTGPFFLSALANGSGYVVVALPAWMVTPCFVALGALIGTRFCGATIREFLRFLVASVGAFMVGISISAVFAGVLNLVTGLPFGQGLLAYAPGGLEAMTLLAFMLGLDPAFVATHQLVRYVGMVLVLPYIIRLTLGRTWNSSRQGQG